MAVGKVSFEDCDIFTSSLGCSAFLPSSSFPRLAMTSLAFMLDWVPLPVCQTTSGKCPASAPEITSSQAASIAPSFSSVIFSGRRMWFARAAAFLRIPNAWTISSGMRSVPMRKFSRLRCVCAPQ